MGNTYSSIQKINYEDVQYAVQQPNNHLLINTLSYDEQKCLIANTLNIQDEEQVINNLIKNNKKEIPIIVYGKHCNDEKIYEKYMQLSSLGFYEVFLYTGGMFEWLMLQDIYGEKEFPTTSKELDLLKYKPNKRLSVSLLKY
jgi:hypothetical protein